VQLIDARGLWSKMRKSLGEKRRYLNEEQVAEVTRLHGSMVEADLVKVVPAEQFGYRTITIDRPLRARWEIGPTTWDGVADDKMLAKLDETTRRAVVGNLEATAHQTFPAEEGCRFILNEILAASGVVKAGIPLLKVLAARCMVRDPEADPVRDNKGRTIADPELRDTENVPLIEDVDEYLAREVHPHVPDAWVADKAGKVGYEIPFTRLFYKYVPPRSSEEIKAELREREARIRQLLEEVLV